MKKLSAPSAVAVCASVMLMALILVEVVPMAEAVTCSVTELNPCIAAFTSNAQPSSACCQKLKQQKPCLCGYLKNPNFKPYVSSPAAKKVASTCGVPFPLVN